MEISHVKALSVYRYEKALSNLAIAKAMLTLGEYGIVLNRAYYSAFDGMRAVNALDGFDSSKHSGVIAHFNQEYVKSEQFTPNTSAIIRKASMFREKSDYEDFYIPKKEEAEEVLAEVEAFVKEVERYLLSKGILSNDSSES